MNVGIDIGYATVKRVNGTVLTFPAQVGQAVQTHDTEIGRPAPDFHLIFPYSLYIGDLAVEQRVGSPNTTTDWFRTKEYKALFLAALLSVTEATHAKITLVSGLPVRYLTYKDEVQNIFLGEHKAQLNNRRAQTLTVDKCKIIPQGIGALASILLDEQGKATSITEELMSLKIGVIDIGGHTTNIISVRNGLREVAEETGSVDVGAWQVERRVRAELYDTYPGLMDRTGEHELIQCVLRGSIRKAGQPIPLAPITEPIIESIGSEVSRQVSRLWNGGDHLDRIYMAGGGAKLFEEYITNKYRHAEMMRNPILANAQGYYNLAMRISGKEN